MKKNIYKIVGVILFIFIGNYFLKSIVNINFYPKNPSGKLVYSYKENEFSDIKKVNYIDNELYFTQKVFEVTKNMNIKDEIILNDENTYGRAVKIGNKYYGINYDRKDDLNFKEVNVKLNKDNSLEEVKNDKYDFSNNEIIKFYENKDFMKEKNILNEEEYKNLSEKIEKEVSKLKDNLNSEYIIKEIKNIMYSNKTEFLVVLGNYNNENKLGIYDSKNNKFYVEDTYSNYLINDIFKFDNCIFSITDKGEIIKLYKENENIKLDKVSNGLKNGKLLGVKDNYIYIRNNYKLVGFNIEKNELKTIFKDSSTDMNRYGIDNLSNFYDGYIVFKVKRKYMIGKLEEDKIVRLVDNVEISDTSTSYITYSNGHCIILNINLDSEGIPKTRIDVYKLY